jgi:hypothetical protein
MRVSMWAGIAQSVYSTYCGLEVPRIEPQWRGDFPHPSTPALGFNRYRVISEGKAAGAWRSSRDEVKGRVELYMYSLPKSCRYLFPCIRRVRPSHYVLVDRSREVQVVELSHYCAFPPFFSSVIGSHTFPISLFSII